MHGFGKKYKPLSAIGADVKLADLKIPLEGGLEVPLWNIIELEIELHMNKFSEKVATQKRRNKDLKKSCVWEAKKIIKHDKQGININGNNN
jgi:hypothetical protein